MFGQQRWREVFDIFCFAPLRMAASKAITTPLHTSRMCAQVWALRMPQSPCVLIQKPRTTGQEPRQGTCQYTRDSTSYSLSYDGRYQSRFCFVDRLNCRLQVELDIALRALRIANELDICKHQQIKLSRLSNQESSGSFDRRGRQLLGYVL